MNNLSDEDLKELSKNLGEKESALSKVKNFFKKIYLRFLQVLFKSFLWAAKGVATHYAKMIGEDLSRNKEVEEIEANFDFLHTKEQSELDELVLPGQYDSRSKEYVGDYNGK